VKVLPEEGWPTEKIETRMRKGEEFGRKCYTEGRHSGAVYHGTDDDHWKFVSKMMEMHVVANPLHIEQFLPVTQMEAEILRMIVTLFHGDEEACGIGTSGGTESILLAMLAYREMGRDRGITNPNIVMSETAHAAIDKAAFYFGMELRKVPVTKDLTCNVSAMKG